MKHFHFERSLKMKKLPYIFCCFYVIFTKEIAGLLVHIHTQLALSLYSKRNCRNPAASFRGTFPRSKHQEFGWLAEIRHPNLVLNAGLAYANETMTNAPQITSLFLAKETRRRTVNLLHVARYFWLSGACVSVFLTTGNEKHLIEIFTMRSVGTSR